MKDKTCEAEMQDFFCKDNVAGKTNRPATPLGVKSSQVWEYPAARFNRLQSFSKSLISNPTYSEVLLLNKLHEVKMNFEFQKVIPPFIVDFFFSKGRFCVEIDGEIHDRSFQIGKDDTKNEILAKRGIVVLRFTNKQVKSNINSVVDEILIVQKERINLSSDYLSTMLSSYKNLTKEKYWKKFKKYLNWELKTKIIKIFRKKYASYNKFLDWRTLQFIEEGRMK